LVRSGRALMARSVRSASMQLRRMRPAKPPSVDEASQHPGVPAWLNARWMGAVALRLLRRPGLWLVAGRQLWDLAPRGWWRRRPYLPLPAPDYLRFRLQTMYGAADHAPDPADLVRWLAWCRSQKAHC
jgi:hypothetical protein